MKKQPMTETEEFNYLWSHADIWKAGWLDGKNGKDSIYDTQKKFDCLKERYAEGYAIGRAYRLEVL